MKSHGLIVCLILMVGYLTPVHSVTDAELEALEKQIEQQEVEEKQQAEAEAKRRAEAEKLAEKKRLAELEKQRQEEQRRFEEEKDKLEQEKRKLEEARQAELDRKQREKEAKRLAEEEQKHKEEEAANARVTVVLFRFTKSGGTWGEVPLTHNDTNIGKLPNRSFLIYISPPGKQTISTDVGYTNYDIDKTFEFEPGQTYYIQVEVGFSYSLELIAQAEGRNTIKGLKNVGKINPADVLSDYDESEAYKEPITTQQQAPL
jgi:phage-related minor tail protein